LYYAGIFIFLNITNITMNWNQGLNQVKKQINDQAKRIEKQIKEINNMFGQVKEKLERYSLEELVSLSGREFQINVGRMCKGSIIHAEMVRINNKNHEAKWRFEISLSITLECDGHHEDISMTITVEK
jgi:hypothetical protein